MHCNSKYEMKIYQKRLISWQWNKNKWIIQRFQQLDHDHDEDDDDYDDSNAELVNDFTTNADWKTNYDCVCSELRMNLWSCNRFVSLSALRNKLPMCEWNKWHVEVCLFFSFVEKWVRLSFMDQTYTLLKEKEQECRYRTDNSCRSFTNCTSSSLFIQTQHKPMIVFSAFRLKSHSAAGACTCFCTLATQKKPSFVRYWVEWWKTHACGTLN